MSCTKSKQQQACCLNPATDSVTPKENDNKVGTSTIWLGPVISELVSRGVHTFLLTADSSEDG